MSEFEWRNGMRRIGGPVEPARDLWPDIAAQLQPAAARRSRMPAFAVAATLLIACAAALIVWQNGNKPAPSLPAVASVRHVINNVVQADDAPHKVLAAATDDVEDASSSIQQALEQRPDAVFLVGLLNRTNSQRMRLLKQSTAG